VFISDTSNENKMSDGWWESASLSVFYFEISLFNGLPAVPSIAWLGVWWLLGYLAIIVPVERSLTLPASRKSKRPVLARAGEPARQRKLSLAARRTRLPKE
jgi:hypothetical protein